MSSERPLLPPSDRPLDPPFGMTSKSYGRGEPDDAATAIAKLRMQLADQHAETIKLLRQIARLVEPRP